MKHQPFTILIHLALAVILAGAIVTHFFGIQGSLTLRLDEPGATRFEQTSGPGCGEFPFAVSLKSVEVIYYPATTTAMDFSSRIDINGQELTISMNKVGEFGGWRFYQSGIGPESSVLAVSRDPWGIGLTYCGYVLLGVGMVGFFFQRRSAWRSLLRQYRRGVVALLLLPALAEADAAELPAMQRPLAANLGKVLVYWNERICPMQTLACDVTSTLYGGESYRGFTPEQILSGWLFFYDQWQSDYLSSHPELKSAPAYPTTKAEKKQAEKLALIELIGTGEIFRIYPYRTADGRMEWLSLTGRRPSAMPLDQWTFMQTTMPEIKELLLSGKNIRANELLTLLMAGQTKYAVGAELPSAAKVTAERIYNRAVRPAPAGVVTILFGLTTLILSLFKSQGRWLPAASLGASILVLLYVASAMGLLWWISGHIPLSNGPETMIFMALAALAGACMLKNLTLRGGLLIVAAMALFVAAMGGRTPRIGSMMPVLSSPLLSVHVVVVMISYALFLLIAILSAVALLSRSARRRRQLGVVNRLLLAPAVCLLGAGIFIGAVWANQTWGRYWGWDPKETCALVMWLVYALPLHWSNRRLAFFRRERVLHTYLLLAVLTVAFTYFGANFLLPGLHSYA